MFTECLPEILRIYERSHPPPALIKKDYNEQRTHSSLGYCTPNEFAELSHGKDGGKTALENASAFASGVSHFSTAPAAVNFV